MKTRYSAAKPCTSKARSGEEEEAQPALFRPSRFRYFLLIVILTVTTKITRIGSGSQPCLCMGGPPPSAGRGHPGRCPVFRPISLAEAQPRATMVVVRGRAWTHLWV